MIYRSGKDEDIFQKDRGWREIPAILKSKNSIGQVENALHFFKARYVGNDKGGPPFDRIFKENSSTEGRKIIIYQEWQGVQGEEELWGKWYELPECKKIVHWKTMDQGYMDGKNEIAPKDGGEDAKQNQNTDRKFPEQHSSMMKTQEEEQRALAEEDAIST